VPAPRLPYRLQTLGLALVFLLGTPPVARAVKADVAPEHGFVDPCNPSIHGDADTHCELCTDAARCRALDGEGYELRCTRHAGDGEVWCASDAPKAGASAKLVTLLALTGVLGLGLYLKQAWSRRSK
jgi:hypothetical protein